MYLIILYVGSLYPIVISVEIAQIFEYAHKTFSEFAVYIFCLFVCYSGILEHSVCYFEVNGSVESNQNS